MRNSNKLLHKNIRQSVLVSTLYLLVNNPNEPSLYTHKLSFRDHISSKINKKYRLIWYYSKKTPKTIILIDIGNHDNVY
ncbi:plasmid stabilization protein [Candidatus Gracilibacteria bacterium]|nr:plasmid stabilization protein [Candidatus Gracilibacteria bacterium]